MPLLIELIQNACYFDSTFLLLPVCLFLVGETADEKCGDSLLYLQ